MINRTKITIHAGGMYQERMSLLDLVDGDAAKKLTDIAAKDGWCEVLPKEAIGTGFDEMVNWSKPETDVLVLVGDKYLVCLNKNDYYSQA